MSGPLYPPGDFGEAFDAAAARLRAAVAASCARPGPWPARVRAAIEAVLEFTEVLARPQGMIGTESQVVINLLGHFFDCGFYARLERVETLSGDDGPVLLVFAGAQGIALDPDELEAFVGRWPDLPASAWIELHVARCLRVVIEPLADLEPE